MDFLNGLQKSRPGQWTGCVVVCDHFTKMIHVKECADHPSAADAAQLFLQLVFSHHGMPKKVITDRGTQFESELWHELMQQMGTKVALATTHHPQTNGLTERANRTLLSMIRKVCMDESEFWVRRLPLLEIAYNSSVHSTTKVPPFLANYGYHPRLPVAFLMLPTTLPPAPTIHAFYRQVKEATRRIWAKIREETQAASLAAELRENRRRGQPQYHAGDEVLCWRHRITGQELPRKHELRYAGPYTVKSVGTGFVELEGLPKGTPDKLNFEYVRPYRRLPVAESL